MISGKHSLQVRRAVGLSILSGLIIFTVFCAQPAQDQAVELKFSISYPAMHPMTTDAFEVWARNVESVTSGRVKITVFPGDSLVSAFTSYDAVQKGACDLVMGVPPYEPNRFPLTMLMNRPLDFPNAVVSGQIAWDLYQEFPEIQEEYKDVKLLFFYSTSAYQFHTPKKPIHVKEDLKGLLIRVGGPVDKLIADALGGIPEFLHMPDTYLALSKGVLDVHMSAFGPMKGFRTADVTRFHVENANLHTSIFSTIVNKEKWNSLSPEDRDAIEGVSGSKAAVLFGRVFDRTDNETIRFMKDKGDTFYRLSAEEKVEWRKVLDVIVEDWVEEQEAKGLPGRKILEATLRLKEKYTRLDF